MCIRDRAYAGLFKQTALTIFEQKTAGSLGRIVPAQAQISNAILLRDVYKRQVERPPRGGLYEFRAGVLIRLKTKQIFPKPLKRNRTRIAKTVKVALVGTIDAVG